MNRIKNISAELFCFFIISAIFLYFFSFSTSHLYKNMYGFDSAIFIVIGKSVANGKLMYSDIFDHKGPVLFFIQYIGWSIGKIFGIFLLQCINLTIVMYIISKMLYLAKLPSVYIIALLVSLLSLLCFTNIEGNQSEEYSLLFLFIPALFILKYVLNKQLINHPPIYSFIYATCFGLVAFNRLSNAASIAAIISGIFLFLIIKQRWYNLFLNIISFLFGLLIISIIVLVPFVYHGTFYDMIYGTFILNFKYSESIGNTNLISKLFYVDHINFFYFILKITPNLFMMIIIIIRYFKCHFLKEFLCFVFIPIYTYIAVNLGLRSNHYLTINAIPLVLGMIFYFYSIKEHIINKKSIANTIILTYIFLMLSYFMYQGRIVLKIYKETQANTFVLKQSETYYYVDISLVNRLINDKEKADVFGYNLPPEWYLKVDAVPPYKYFANQESWIKSDSAIYYETNKYLTTTSPTWIVIPNKKIAPWTIGVKSNPILEKLLKSNYILKGEDINNRYYRKLENK